MASDMAGYLRRARGLVEHGDLLYGPAATLFPPGTHWLLALGLALGDLPGGAALWALLGAAAPVLGWLLAERVGGRPWMAPALGVALLLWPPHLSHSGYFLSETPFLTLTLLATWLLAGVRADGRGALAAGIALAAAFLVRPQIALWAALAGPLLLWGRGRALARLAAPGVVAAALLVGLFRSDTGHWGLTGNASLNRAVSRCSALRLEVYPTEEDRQDAILGLDARRTWWLEPPSLRERYQRLPADHPLGVRPVYGPGPLRVVGRLLDPALHDRLARRCVATTGPVEQARSAVVRVVLLFWGERPWPEQSWSRPAQRRAVRGAHRGMRWVVLPLAALGLVAVARRRGRAGWLGPLHVAALVATSAAYFGSLRLRAWADPYLLLLALEGVALLAQRPKRNSSGSR